MSSQWRNDVDSLAFRPEGHAGWCLVHRRALRTLIGHAPTPAEAQTFFRTEAAAFQRAAGAKIHRAGLAREANFHLTSRDLRRGRDVAPGTESAGPILDTDSPRQ